MSEKQDRTYPRTASDLERKYNFDRRFSEILGIANDAQTHAYNAETAIRKWSQRIGNLEGSYAQIEMRQNRITSRVATAEGNYSSIKQTVDGIHHEVFGEDGKFSSIKQTVDGIHHEVFGEDGKSSIKQTVDGIYHEVFGEDGKSSIRQTVDGIHHEVFDKDGSFSSITQEVGKIQHEVFGEDGKSSIRQTVDGIHKEVFGEGGVNAKLALTLQTDAKGNLSSKVHIGADTLTIDTDKFTLAEDGSISIRGGDFGGLMIEEDCLQILNTEGRLRLFNKGVPRLLLNKDTSGTNVDAYGITIHKDGGDFSGTGWINLTNESTMYRLFLDYDTHTVRFETINI